MKILLTHTYFLNEDPLEQKIMKPYPPLGILYLSAWLKQNGKQVQVFDTTFKTRGELFAFIREEKPDIVGIHCNMMTKPVVLALIDFCKEKQITTLLGGPDAVTQTEEFLNYGADIIVAGEGEESTLNLINHLQEHDKHNLHDLPNVSFKDQNGQVINNPKTTSKKQLDTFPFPDREAIDMEKYLHTWQTHHGQRSLSLVTARGCAFTCKWCSHSVYGFTHRRRKPEKVIEELKQLIPAYKPTHVWYVDDVFTVNKRWLRRFADLLKEEKILLPFECIARGDRIDHETVHILKEMGCYRIWFGAESGSQRILDAMSRGVSKEQIRNAVNLCREAGIESGLFVMFGYPSETYSDIKETIRFISKVQPSLYLTTTAYPLRGTVLFEEKKQDVIYTHPWQFTEQRALDIKGRFNQRMYYFAAKKLASDFNRYKKKQSGIRHLKSLLHTGRSFWYHLQMHRLKETSS